jgi:hypothetical protein
MASVSFPTTSFPNFPNIDLSALEMPSIDTDAIANAAKDAAYVTIGLGVLGFQQAQVRRRELAKALTDQLGNGRAQIDEVVDAIEARFGEHAGAIVTTAQDAARTAREQVRNLLARNAATQS